MNSSQYINELKSNISRYFNIYENHEFNGQVLPLYAKSLVRNERYIGSKKLVTDAYENYEYFFIKSTNENVEENNITSFTDFLISTVNKIVIPNEEHMSTVIDGVYITDSNFSEGAIKKAKKFKFGKTFSFGLKGWCDINLILIELGNKEIYTNRSGRKAASLYYSILKK